MQESDDEVIAATQDWLVKAVIGLNLCPFARAVYAGGRLRCAVSRATTPEALLEDLAQELQRLAAADEAALETTLLIHPQVLGDFLDFARQESLVLEPGKIGRASCRERV